MKPLGQAPVLPFSLAVQSPPEAAMQRHWSERVLKFLKTPGCTVYPEQAPGLRSLLMTLGELIVPSVRGW